MPQTLPDTRWHIVRPELTRTERPGMTTEYAVSFPRIGSVIAASPEEALAIAKALGFSYPIIDSAQAQPTKD